LPPCGPVRSTVVLVGNTLACLPWVSATLAASARTLSITPLAPSNTSAPMVTGVAEQGQMLTDTNGARTSDPTGYSYQW
jgi:hypothetical protein